MTAVLTPAGFADDPVASHSGQFGLARPFDMPSGEDAPSSVGLRPWSLRGMQPPAEPAQPLPEWRYDHERQTAVDAAGRDLVVNDASAKSVSDLDGDEGRSEDWVYDFAPDFPGPLA